MENKREHGKSDFWPFVFGAFFLSISIWFAMGFIVAFNPAVKKDPGWEPFMWFSGNYALTQWLYFFPIALLLQKRFGAKQATGVLVAGLVVTSLMTMFQKF